jgi:hypothetical protein
MSTNPAVLKRQRHHKILAAQLALLRYAQRQAVLAAELNRKQTIHLARRLPRVPAAKEMMS